jgi:hypothetical protein
MRGEVSTGVEPSHELVVVAGGSDPAAAGERAVAAARPELLDGQRVVDRRVPGHARGSVRIRCTEHIGSIRGVRDTSSAPGHPGKPLRGDRALAVRVIRETGARAAERPYADVLHHPSRRPLPEVGLDRVPGDVVRRALRRADRSAVRHLGRVMLLLRRGGGRDAVEWVHRLDHRCSELELRLTALEADRRTGAGG